MLQAGERETKSQEGVHEGRSLSNTRYYREKRALVLVEECKAPDFKKSNHCRSRSLSCTSLARNFS
jgi:hypothetical protein